MHAELRWFFFYILQRHSPQPGDRCRSSQRDDMEWHTSDDELRQKREELLAEARALLDQQDSGFAEHLVDAFCQLSPPLWKMPDMQLVTLHSGGLRGGETRKLGNLQFNWRRLVGESPDMILTLIGTLAVPALFPLAALSLWNKYVIHSSVTLSREQATALFAMWTRRDRKNRISRSDALNAVNDLVAVFKLPSVDADEFSITLNDLVHLKCIEIDADVVWLREWVSTKYGRQV